MRSEIWFAFEVNERLWPNGTRQVDYHWDIRSESKQHSAAATQ